MPITFWYPRLFFSCILIICYKIFIICIFQNLLGNFLSLIHRFNFTLLINCGHSILSGAKFAFSLCSPCRNSAFRLRSNCRHIFINIFGLPFNFICGRLNFLFGSVNLAINFFIDVTDLRNSFHNFWRNAGYARSFRQFSNCA